ncbi:MAG: class 1 fructose-bisphosphatase [Planctomycetales bacterium]|nr:class 1 fructose-bisphosphatase [Planctomycetales bacterium]
MQTDTNANTVITFEQHTLLQQKRYPGASGSFAWLLSGITLATKIIQAKVRRAGLGDLLGEAGATNVQGETQQKLDVFSNQVMLHYLGLRDSVGILASEENEEPFVLKQSADAKYIVVFDPLDGSSNIDVNVSVGTTFSILRRPNDPYERDDAVDLLQPGYKQVAGGYVLYGSSTMLVYSAGNGVHGFTLDPAVGAYVLSHENIRMPEQGKWYSANEAHIDTFPPAYQKFILGLRRGEIGKKYASRYIGSMVADVHRTLLKGGVFLYPPTSDNPHGKLRLMYEANPIAFLIEQAGGTALAGRQRILDIQPESIHQRTPMVCGGRREMEFFERCLGEED